MTTSAQSIVNAIREHRDVLYTMEEKIEQKLSDPTFYMNEAIRYLQGYAYVIYGNVKSHEEVEDLKQKYTKEGWGFFVEYRGLMSDYICVTIRLKLPDEFTSYLDECKALSKQITSTKNVNF